MMADLDIVDVWAQQPNPTFSSQPWLDSLLRWTGQTRDDLANADLTEVMDAADVRVALLSAWCGADGMLISNDEVAEVDAPMDVKGLWVGSRGAGRAGGRRSA